MMTKRVLVTGLNGFSGYYVADSLRRNGHEVVGLDMASDQRVDLTDFGQVHDAVTRLQPTAVIHLAGVSSVTDTDLGNLYNVNVVGAKYLLTALTEVKGVEAIILPSTAYVYRTSGSPHSEDDPIQPTNDYGISKYAMELTAANFYDRLPICIVRPFNYTGRGQAENFIIPKLVNFARAGEGEIPLGNTSSVREFVDVRDVADIYARMIADFRSGDVLNISGGRGYRISEVITKLEAMTGRSLFAQEDAGFIRKGESSILIGNGAKLTAAYPGFAFRPLEETLAWMLEP